MRVARMRKYPWWVYGLIALLVLIMGFVYRACYEYPPAVSARLAGVSR